MDLWKTLFSTGNYMPHIHCYLYTPALVWLHVASDMLIGLSYVAISLMLAMLVKRGRGDIPFHGMFLAFGLFIVACGATHFMEVWTLWNAHYWVSGGVKVVTAAASVATAVALPPLLPVALGMVRAARVSEQRRTDLEHANEELTRLNHKLREYDHLKTQFFANVSHELRTPLTLILGPAERLANDPTVEERHRNQAATVLRNAQVLLKHVNDLLDLSRLDAGKLEVHYEQIDLSRLVRYTAAHFQTLAQDHDVSMAVHTPEALPAEVDPDKLERVLLNLLSNAFKFTPAGGSIRCTLEAVQREGEAAEYARLSVRDSGPGVPPEIREQIFERFAQAERHSRQYGGTGLGLAIARDFVRLHSGELHVQESPEGGAEFVLEVPLAAPAGARVETPLSSPPSAPVASSDQPLLAMEELRAPSFSAAPPALALDDQAPDDQRATALVVEDNVELRSYISEILADQYHVVTAANGEEGLARALEVRPSLVVTDVMMPGMTGEQLVHEIWRHSEIADTPVIILTAKADNELRFRMLREGVSDYVIKPFVAEELKARASNLVVTKRARDLLRGQLESHSQDLEVLAREVAARNRELATALESMRVARDHAEHASQVKTNFLRMVSHELRTPLTTLQLQVQLLERSRDNPLSEKQKNIVRKVHHSSLRLQELIESLLEYARIQSGRLTINVEPVDLPALAEDVFDEVRPQAELKSIRLSVTAAPEVGPLRSDRRLVRLVLINLVGNAVKYTDGGDVEVLVTPDPGGHRISVTDNGPGIPLEQQTVIFEPFEQLEAVRYKHTPGVGLGLAIVKEIVNALGGSIQLHSEVGKGSTFSVILPPVPPQKEEAEVLPPGSS